MKTRFTKKINLPTAENMVDIKVQVEVQLVSNASSGQDVFEGLQESDGKVIRLNTIQGEELSLLTGAALAPPGGDQAVCSCDCEACCFVRLDGSLQSTQLQLQFLLSKADDLQYCLVNGQGHPDIDALAAAVRSFLYTCQPFFNHLESAVRSRLSQFAPLPFDTHTRRVQLLDFSQQLCDKLEQLVMAYASYNVLSLDETEPNSVSHFCIGQSQLGRLRLTTFLYCKPTPFMARVDTGLYKRMRWNVDRLRDEQQQMDEEQGGESDAGTMSDTEYYFLCYEDSPNTHADDGDSQGVSCANMVRLWSIGQWVQEDPDPNTEDIFDWTMCEVPQASYHRLLFLGSDEPSSCSASYFLQQVLLSQQTTE